MLSLIISDMTHEDLMFFGIFGALAILGTVAVTILGAMYLKEVRKC